MADLSFEIGSRLGSDDLRAAYLAVVDRENKICAAVEALGPVAGSDVVVLEAGGGARSCSLAETAAGVTALIPPGHDAHAFGEAASGRIALAIGTPEATGLPDASADVVVSFWSAFDGPDSRQLAEADRILRPGGRLLIVHDYGRDDVCGLWRPSFERQVEWSRRDGPFLSLGFRIRVIHCWWTFESVEQARALLESAFGEAGAELAGRMKRPRLEYNVAIYHRTRGAVSREAVLVGSATQ